MDKNVIIVGDLNAKHYTWNSKTNNVTRRTLYKYIDARLDTTITALDTPTRYPTHLNQNPDVLDVAIVKAGQLSYQIENLPTELSLDHSPIFLNIKHCSTQFMPPQISSFY